MEMRFVERFPGWSSRKTAWRSTRLGVLVAQVHDLRRFHTSRRMEFRWGSVAAVRSFDSLEGTPPNTLLASSWNLPYASGRGATADRGAGHFLRFPFGIEKCAQIRMLARSARFGFR
jgi:hypothetical protein